MRLHSGEVAPHFDIPDLYGRLISLSAYYGRPVLLSFFRSAVCPLCNMRLWHLLQRYPTYRQQGLHVIAFFESTPEYAWDYLERFQAPFPLIADPGATIYERYGLATSWLGTARGTMRRSVYLEARRRGLGDWRLLAGFFAMDGRKFRMPADFLLGPDLRIRSAHYGRDSGDFLMFSELESALQSPRLWYG
jgi:peroxiredoxin